MLHDHILFTLRSPYSQMIQLAYIITSLIIGDTADIQTLLRLALLPHDIRHLNDWSLLIQRSSEQHNWTRLNSK